MIDPKNPQMQVLRLAGHGNYVPDEPPDTQPTRPEQRSPLVGAMLLLWSIVRALGRLGCGVVLLMIMFLVVAALLKYLLF